MAKPRVFVSSTYYDLRHVRDVLENFIRQFGYDPILFEKGEIPFVHTKSLEDNCVTEVESADILILIIGGRYGSLSREDQDLVKTDPEKFFSAVRSVTRKEYEKARERDIPIFIFVDENILAEYKTYQENRDNGTIKYAHVDDVRIYAMLDDIFKQQRNNYVKGFSSHEEILTWLREQWAGIFADSLKRRQTETKLSSLEAQIRELTNVVSSLKTYSEEIVKSVEKGKSKEIITKVNTELKGKRLIDFGRHALIRFAKEISSKKLSDADLFQKFSSAKTIDDFFASIETNDIDRLNKVKSRPGPRQDFEELKATYEMRER